MIPRSYGYSPTAAATAWTRRPDSTPHWWTSGTAARTKKAHGIPDDATVIGYVGRLVKDKGIAELAEAWKRIRNGHKDAWLLLIGPPESHNPVQGSILEDFRNDPRVTTIDYVPNRRMPIYYGIMDLPGSPYVSRRLPHCGAGSLGYGASGGGNPG